MRRLDAIADRYQARRDTSDVRAAIRLSPGAEWSWTAPHAREQFAVASTTKLVTAALALSAVDRGLLRLDTAAMHVLGRAALDGLHVRRGLDARPEITVERLLNHSTGIADYFADRGNDGRVLQRDLLAADQSWDARSAIDRMRGVRPHGRPGARLAHYSDTNYRLLELILEEVEGETFADLVRTRITEPLGLGATFLLTPETLDRVGDLAPLKAGTEPLVVPRALASAGADGSLVSTVDDLLALSDALFGARLFSRELLERATSDWRWMLVPPGRYGLGIMRVRFNDARAPRLLPPLVGHSGITGAVLFHSPDEGITIAAGVNQFAKPALGYRFMAELVSAALR
ncbi:serine hydrolase domain-containing protein [Demequina lignilytica]|uniref:Serine hydrolase domain-containing protein n=1 Tax=Demequina lignilytica TaxID=3051663 RepID=A0AB35MFG5_9MICO|nr:serine hydrolase domain-containing protein [Demequina sp. SYSU T0a273]MDN4482514.1 serine hydrolase domain-containing protein [Demequina sp. SYSU T0a273]